MFSLWRLSGPPRACRGTSHHKQNASVRVIFVTASAIAEIRKVGNTHKIEVNTRVHLPTTRAMLCNSCA